MVWYKSGLTISSLIYGGFIINNKTIKPIHNIILNNNVNSKEKKIKY